VIDEPQVVAVVVAHDRRELLAHALHALADQTAPLARVVVVDNASTDGSAEVARGVAAARGLPLDLLALPRNTGGAGGFAAGLARALHGRDPHLVWLMDDDTVPTPTALAELLAARARRAAAAGPGAPPPVLLASRVVWHDGREHPMNTPRTRPGVRRAEARLAAAAGAAPVRSASFVSCLVDAAAVRRAGLPVAAYFLWNDDFEFTTRLLRRAAGLHVPASVVVHRTRVFGGTDADPGPRFRYEVRNKLWMLTRSGSLAPWEKALYGASTLRRWARTVARSSARGVLLRAGAAGLVEGLRAGPVPTPAVLGGLGAVTGAVAALERGAGRARP
jgi:GT2 family glycosyltransferase